MKILVNILLALALPLSAWGAGSPWLPMPKSGDIGVTYVSQSADNFWRGPDGDVKGPLPFGELDQETVWFRGSYGLSDSLALDFEIGTSETDPANSPPPKSDGRTDLSLGATWRFVDEYTNEQGLPSMAVRGALVVAGNYDVGLPTAIGDGADGFDASVIVGKIFAERIALSGEFGIRSRDSGVPDSTFVNLNAYLLLSSRFILETQFHTTASNGELNICGPCGPPSPPGAPGNFPLVEEEMDRIMVGATFNLTDQLSAGFRWYTVLDGRNTGEFDAFAINANYSFDLYRLGL